jgi:hypothetical protein
MTMNDNFELLTDKSFLPLKAALRCIADEGLQAPSVRELTAIIFNGLLATQLLTEASILPLEPSALQEFFCDFVLRCTNRGPGVGDAASN